SIFENIDWQQILQRLEALATSAVGRERIHVLAPLKAPEEAARSFNDIFEAQRILKRGHRPFMESLDLYPVWYQRLSKEAVLKPLELKDVRHFCLECIAFQTALNDCASEWAMAHSSRVLDATEPLSAIEQLMTS